MSLAQQTQETAAIGRTSADGGIASINQLKLRLSQLETQLSRLAVVHGLGYGSLKHLAHSFLKVKQTLLKLAGQHSHDRDLVDLAESLLTEASETELCTLEEELLNVRRLAQDPAKQQFSAAYQSLMGDLLMLEQQLQAALQKALGNIAG